MKISIYKGLTRNPEMGNTHTWIFPAAWRLGKVTKTIFGTNVSNEKLLNAATCQSYSFHRFGVIKEKPAGCKNTLSSQVKVNPIQYGLFRGCPRIEG